MSADRNLLFGILAVQLDFVTQDELIAGMNAWLLAKAKPLGEILRDLGHLPPARLDLLDALVAEHLKQHGGDPKRSLAALSSVEPIKRALTAVADADVQGTLPQVGAGPAGTLPHPGSAAPASGVRYRILRPHKRGGLGEVYVAEDMELGRSVALKEIQGRFADDAGSRSRFVLEAEITGGLEHPGIVPVYGLGTYSDGRPFYAMRFIQGDNLQDAIRRFHAPGSPDFTSLAFRDLLRRFIDVCNAIAYAHARGVLHRDLKPGNVMLGQYGETLVVDWGLAKALGRSDGEATLVPRTGGDATATIAGQAMGTPAYMSPEQADGRVGELGPATDVYSLGATLYELLTGKVPFAGKTQTELLDAVKSGRFPPPRAVSAAVPPALEAVCLKCMALRPADRYAAMTASARDIERWLADEPVSAYAEPAGVRLRRWVRRHARLVTGIAAALAVGVVSLGVGAVLLAAGRERERAERVAKETALARAEADRDSAREQKRRTRAALDEMLSKEMVERLGMQKQLTAGQKAFLQKALGYYREFAAEAATEEEGRKLEADAHARVGFLLLSFGQRPEAMTAYRAARTAYETLAADFPAADYRRDLAGSHHNLGLLLMDLNRLPEAEAAFRAGLALREKLAADFPAAPSFRAELAHNHNNLGTLLADLGKWPEAEAAHRAALAALEKLIAESPATPTYRFELARNHNNLGTLFVGLDKRPEAEAAHRAALAVLEKLVAELPAVTEYRRALAGSRNNLGTLLAGQNKWPEAEATFRAALAVQEKLTADFPATPDYRLELAASQNNLGNLFSLLGKRREAEAAFGATLAAFEKLVADSPGVTEYVFDLAGSYSNFGNFVFGGGDAASAIEWHAKAIVRLAPVVAANPRLAAARQTLRNSHLGRAKDFTALKRYADALPDWQRALEFDSGSDRDPLRLGRADCLARLGRSADADAAADELASAPTPTAAFLYDCACVYALASAAPPSDAVAAKAAATLRRAVAAGYRDVPHLLADDDLAPLRRRDDYAALLWELADIPANAAR